MAIASPGLGSGLDVNGIVTQLMAIEQQPLIRLAQKEAGYQAEISAYGALKSALADLQSSLENLNTADTFQATKTTSSDEDVLAVSAGSNAVPSTFDITVNRLAQRHKMGSSEFANTTTFGGQAGDGLTVTVGTGSFTLDLSTASTLRDIQEAINVSANETGVTASVITGDSGNQTLVLTSEESGYDGRVQISYGGAIDATTFNFASINRDADGLLLSADTELDASLVVDGIGVTRSSNSISDVVEGMTFDLNGTGRAVTTISRDPSVAEEAVQGFVTAYNGLKAQLSAQSAGSLSGNRVLINIESKIRGELNHSLSGLGNISYISELGVTTNKDTGDLELDSDRLSTAITDDLDGVSAFFSDEEGGFAFRLDSMLDGFLQADGIFDSMIDGVNDRIDAIDRSRDSLERRLELTEQRLRSQFTSLDTLMVQMTTTSDYLSGQLEMLSKLSVNSLNNK